MATRAAAITCHVLPSTLIYSSAATKMLPTELKKETQMRKGQIEELKTWRKSIRDDAYRQEGLQGGSGAPALSSGKRNR